jgi:hypothetical protein
MPSRTTARGRGTVGWRRVPGRTYFRYPVWTQALPLQAVIPLLDHPIIMATRPRTAEAQSLGLVAVMEAERSFLRSTEIARRQQARSDELRAAMVPIDAVIPYERSELVARARSSGDVEEQYEAAGVRLSGRLPRAIAAQVLAAGRSRRRRAVDGGAS